MSDVRLSVFDYGGDILIENGDLVSDPGLFTPVLISLFTDNRAPLDVELPAGANSRRGWWHNTNEESVGSLLWLINREKATNEVAARAEDYASDALLWLLDLGIASEVLTEGTIVSSSLQLLIKIRRGPAKEYAYLWEGIKLSEKYAFGNTSIQLIFEE